ncbi:MAG TPA: hypothetical protein VFT85_05150, partial [Acidimicrobiia bacterium]|nr:hypothetical protein [Acidimicrobiia bacterium]
KSGAGVRRSQVVAALWALTGGRLHDTSRAIREITDATSENLESAIHLNAYSLEEGYPAFAEVYNEGRSPDAIVTDPFGIRTVPRARLALKLGLPFTLIVAVIGLAIQPTRWLAVAALAPPLIHAGGLGLIRADNFRFLLPSAVYAVVLATAIAVRIYEEWNAEPRSAQLV